MEFFQAYKVYKLQSGKPHIEQAYLAAMTIEKFHSGKSPGIKYAIV